MGTSRSAAVVPVDPVHIASGYSAGGGLKVAVEQLGLPGRVVVLDDDLSQGPLEPAAARATYWQESIAATPSRGEWRVEGTWVKLLQAVASSDDLVVWTGQNANELVLLAAVCAKIDSNSVRIWQVDTDTSDGHYVAEYPPKVLAGFFADRLRLLDSRDRDRQSADYRQIAKDTGALRGFSPDHNGGRIIDLAPDHFDDLLIAAATADFQLSSRVVGQAMGECDARHRMGDLFFGNRLRYLVDVNRLEADRPMGELGEWSVRLNGASG